MICQQCGQAVMLDMASDHLPPWCQRCGADIRDALYGANANAAALPAAVLTTAPTFDSRPLPVRDRARPESAPEADARSRAAARMTALFLGIALFAAAIFLALFQLLS
jgi:hypothetical protein